MSEAWKALDLEGGGLQQANLRLARMLRHRGVTYALLAAFPLGLHRDYLQDRCGAWLYRLGTAAAIVVTLVGGIVPGGVIALALAIAAIFDLARVEEFPGDIAYVAPEPDRPLIELIHELTEAYPETPPYAGTFDHVVPHVTIASLDVADIGSVRSRVAPLLPVRCNPHRASLVEEYEPDRWREWHALPFTGAA